ncbi:MAG TPA: 3'(2'),5'-bisphosphate nucleotidase [Flavobacteriales bacterium]|nr:3'(2'),5'-bisphosphate nucleotidase CysQ [Flavobacteriales bacterium]HIN40331.1 3'(2'),5'-bisphosphate nucleotidase [Flavobacteriales bacterium]
METEELKRLLKVGIVAALEASEEILEVYGMDDFQVEVKEDKSPLTIADKRSNARIEQHLIKTGIPILSEEGEKKSFNERKEWETLWVVDPLDGTKEFVKRNGEFTVNIALVHNNRPVLGVIYVPIKETLYFAAENYGAYKLNINSGGKEVSGIESLVAKATKLPSVMDKEEFVVVGSRSHMSVETHEFINKLKKSHDRIKLVSAGSALKLCMVAEGVADIYPRFAPTMEWDIASGHAIANEAGKRVVVHSSGNELEYNRENLVNPWFVVKE